MPTDFSFVSDEGWEALKPQFERAEKKLEEKVKRKDLSQDQARKLKDLMWEKYQRWADGKGMKEKENQTVFDGKPTKKASMQREARIGRTQLIDILNAVTDGTIQNSAVFQQTLELNRVTEPEFFDAMAQDVARYPQLYPKQLVGYFGEHFTDWGYEGEIKKVIDQSRGAVGPNPPPSYDRPAPPTPQPAPASSQPTAPAATPAATQAPAERPQKPAGAPVEPSPWPQDVNVPPPSKKGPTQRFYLRYTTPDGQEKAGVVNDLSFDDFSAFAQALSAQGYKPGDARALKKSEYPAAAPAAQTQVPPAPAPASAPTAPTAPAKPAKVEQAPSAVPGQIETPDLKDPNTYRWYIKFQVGSRKPAAISPDLNGAEVTSLKKRYEQMGIKILEMTKMNISPKASIILSDDIRTAADGEPVEKFRNGTPIIFTEDVNLEFDALSARGQIKKNMTGKIKKVEDNDYLVDIAGQLYRVPRLVAEHVMDVFAANVVSDVEIEEPGQEQGQKPAQTPAAQPQKAQAPAAQPAAPATGQNQGQLPPGGAPKMPAGMAKVLDRIVVADSEESDFYAEMGMDADARTQYEREHNPCDVCPHMSSWHDFSDGGNYACQKCAAEGGPCANGYQPKDPDFTEYREQVGPAKDPVDPYANPGGTIGNPMTSTGSRLVVSDIEIEAAMNNRMLARAFANGATSGKGSHMFIDGDTIYSYGRHFPVATRGEDAVYVTTKTYSVSTARHISLVRSALYTAAVHFVESDLSSGGKVLKPTPQEIAAREAAEAEAQAKRDRLDEKRRLREQKKLTQKRQQVPEERAQDIAETENKNIDDKAYIEQHDESGRPLKWRVDRTLAPSTLEETQALTPEQWMARIQDVEDQLLREKDPARQEKLRQRMERMKQAAFTQAMRRVAGTDNPMGGEKADMNDLHDLMKERDKNTSMGKEKSPKLENKRPQTAAVQSQGFSDLLMLIEKGGPGIPSEIGKRLYRADGAVSRISA